jgi:hypothetical protein
VLGAYRAGGGVIYTGGPTVPASGS